MQASDGDTLDRGSRAVGTVLGVNGNIVRAHVDTGTLRKNEVAYVCVGQERLKAEVLRIYGADADLQVFEETYGIRYGDRVEFTGQLLSVQLGPGMLGSIYDGLQSPLTELAEKDGFFLKRGREVFPIDCSQEWNFTPLRKAGEEVRAGEPLGTVKELAKLRFAQGLPWANITGRWALTSCSWPIRPAAGRRQCVRPRGGLKRFLARKLFRPILIRL